jgi:hypothetical protein
LRRPQNPQPWRPLDRPAPPKKPINPKPQLADFGLTKILNEADHSVNLDGAGTVTHLAPEMFRAGTKITKAVDAYAFGVLMWETYTSRRAYAGMQRDAVIERVYKAGLRPRFPGTAPAGFAGLAEACWQSDPARRPAFAEVAERLEAMASELGPARPASAAGAAAAAAAAYAFAAPAAAR